jgi:CRISPR-associated protein Cmr1
MISELRLNLRVLTPLFLGDAEQQAELRAPGIKGPLRYWYRAADPGFDRPWAPGARLTREDRLFGGTRPGAGQSPGLLRIESDPPTLVDWPGLRPERFNRGQGRDIRNGLIYLGYTFGMGDNRARTAIVPDHEFKVRCVLPRRGDADPVEGRDLRRAWTAAWWLLCHLGGLGSRSRRGFGSVALTGWEGSGADWPELAELPLLADAADATGARAALSVGLARIRQWFESDGAAWAKDALHPHLGQLSRSGLLEPGHARWDAALAEAGSRMQEFRLRRAPDYQMVKDHVRARTRQGGQLMRATPERASFGLPLTFRFTSVNAPPLTLVPHDARGGGHFERHGSLLHLRLLVIAGRLHPLFVRLDGAVPGAYPPAMVRDESRPLEPFAVNAMDRFMDSLTGGQTHG